MVRHWGASSLAEHVVPAELNADIRLEPGKHELTAEEIAAAKANTAAIANGYGLYLVGVPGGRFRHLQSGQLYGVREPVQNFLPPARLPGPGLKPKREPPCGRGRNFFLTSGSAHRIIIL